MKSSSSPVRNHLIRLGVAACMASAFLFAACGGDDSTATTKTDAGSDAAKDVVTADTTPNDVSIAAAVTYNGTLQGPVLCSAFSTPMPMGAPAGTGSNEKPTWPGTNTVNLKNVNPGHYFVFSYIMVGAEHRMGPNFATDPSGPPVEVTVVAGQTAAVPVMLFDPMPPGDGGMDGGMNDGSDSG